MRIQVNGEAREVEEGTTVGGLVRQLALAPERLAVELNREVVRRARWEETALADGDKIEVVHFVGGGCSDSPRPPSQAFAYGLQNSDHEPDVLTHGTDTRPVAATKR